MPNWYAVKDGDPRAVALYRRHYSAANVRHGQKIDYARHGFSGPGEAMILLTVDGRALFGWLKSQYRRDYQEGVNCFIFRNESPILSSTLIREADELAWQRWPGDRLFTFVDASKTMKGRSKASPPGKCFIEAGWHECGLTGNGLVILEKLGIKGE